MAAKGRKRRTGSRSGARSGASTGSGRRAPRRAKGPAEPSAEAPSIALGRQVADAALARRAEALRRWQRPPVTRAAAAAGPEALGFAAPKAPPAPVLVAEGDSWFDYPGDDVLHLLEDKHHWDVESVAHKGDRIEGMAYGKGQLGELIRRIEKVVASGRRVKAVLLSGGGNDIAGGQFEIFLNHAGSGLPHLSEAVMRGVIDERLREAYRFVLAAVTRVCTKALGAPVPILVHGYDYPVPDGRGFWGGAWVLPGPWLEPGFRLKDYGDLGQRVDVMRVLIDRFNEMVAALAGSPEFPHVRYVELRGALSTALPKAYKDWWANELHPTDDGFEKVADRFQAVLATV